jgi:hypothetical protein
MDMVVSHCLIKVGDAKIAGRPSIEHRVDRIERMRYLLIIGETHKDDQIGEVTVYDLGFHHNRRNAHDECQQEFGKVVFHR